MDAPIALSITDTCRSLGIGRTKVYELIALGRLRARKIGYRTVIVFEDIKRLIDEAPAANIRQRPTSQVPADKDLGKRLP